MTRLSEIFIGVLLMLAIAACDTPGPRPYVSSSPSHAAQTVVAPATLSSQKGDPDQRFKAALKLMKDHEPEAQAAFLALSQDFPKYSGALTDLGILYAQGRHREQALASFSQAVATNPANAVALNWLGILYRENNDFARSEQSYQKALALRPDYAAAHLNLGILYDVSLRRPQEALTQYREYQKYAGDRSLIVSAWIKELELAAPVKTTVASESAP